MSERKFDIVLTDPQVVMVCSAVLATAEIFRRSGEHTEARRWEHLADGIKAEADRQTRVQIALDMLDERV